MDQRSIKKNREKYTRILRNFIPKGIILLFLFFISNHSKSQELFPNTEPASTMPKNVFGYRLITEMYKDLNNRSRYFTGLRLMYGLTKKITIMSMIGASNHHLKKIPPNFTNYMVNHHSAGYPNFTYQLEGFHTYIKYRFVNFDGDKKHFRIAGYAEGTKSFAAHTEGESNLMTDNTGYGGGLIFTYLYNRFATSVTWGFINTLPYTEYSIYRDIKFKSGDLKQYNISFGYRIYPKKYDSYKNININLYTEFMNRDYNSAEIYYDNIPYDYEFLKPLAPYTYNGLIAKKYSEMRNSIQFIFDSSTRLDVGFAIPVYNRSYLHDYPLIFINVQKYIFD